MEITPTHIPTFVVAGAAKCGTTSLYHYLAKHPEVYMSPIKETNHFSTDINPDDFTREYKLHEERKGFNLDEWLAGGMQEKRWGWYVKKRDQYLQLFSKANEQRALGEISNSYLYSETAANVIRRDFPEMKVVMMLRNPADRLYSHYLANVRDGKTTRPLMEEIKYDLAKREQGWGKSHLYVGLGLYAKQVNRFKDAFPDHQLRIYFHDDYKADPASLIRDLFRFIGVNDSVNVDFTERHNEARAPKSTMLIYGLSKLGLKKRLFRMVPDRMKKKVKAKFFSPSAVTPLSSTDRKEIMQFYMDDIRELSQITGRNLDHWFTA